MANIAPIGASNAGILAPLVATTPAGDIITPVGSGALMIEFDNGHASAITITIAPNSTNAVVPGFGKVTLPSRTIVLAAGGKAVFAFGDDDKSGYQNPAGGIPITYTGGNAALLVRAIQR